MTMTPTSITASVARTTVSGPNTWPSLSWPMHTPNSPKPTPATTARPRPAERPSDSSSTRETRTTARTAKAIPAMTTWFGRPSVTNPTPTGIIAARTP